MLILECPQYRSSSTRQELQLRHTTHALHKGTIPTGHNTPKCLTSWFWATDTSRQSPVPACVAAPSSTTALPRIDRAAGTFHEACRALSACSDSRSPFSQSIPSSYLAVFKVIKMKERRRPEITVDEGDSSGERPRYDLSDSIPA